MGHFALPLAPLPLVVAIHLYVSLPLGSLSGWVEIRPPSGHVLCVLACVDLFHVPFMIHMWHAIVTWKIHVSTQSVMSIADPFCPAAGVV